MHELRDLLQQRNEWVTKFLRVTEGYYAQLQSNPDGAIAGVSEFVNNRQSLINIIQRIEKKITQSINLLKINAGAPAHELGQVKAADTERESLAEKISNLDAMILRILSRAKDETEIQLKNVIRGKKAISGYRQDSSAATKVDVQR